MNGARSGPGWWVTKGPLRGVMSVANAPRSTKISRWIAVITLIISISNATALLLWTCIAKITLSRINTAAACRRRISSDIRTSGLQDVISLSVCKMCLPPLSNPLQREAITANFTRICKLKHCCTTIIMHNLSRTVLTHRLYYIFNSCNQLN